MFIIGPIWLIFILFLLSTPTGARVATALACALIGVLVLVGIGTAVGDANRATALENGSFDCRASVKADDKEIFKGNAWSYCIGQFGGEEQWQAYLDADRDRRDAEFAQRRADEEAATAAKDTYDGRTGPAEPEALKSPTCERQSHPASGGAALFARARQLYFRQALRLVLLPA